MAIENDFFNKLASRFWKETKLSDMIWAMCCSNIKFQNIFLEYCFEEKISVFGEMIREYSRGDSIPDFYFLDIYENKYIIENKIGDRKEHFGQYIKSFPEAKRAFIANYFEPDHDGWKVKKWNGFIKHLEGKVNEFQEHEKNFVNGFICYLKSVLNYMEAKSMDLSNISSLTSFFIVLEEVFSECEQVKFSKYGPYSDALHYGIYFSYSNERQKNVFIGLGLFFPEQSGVYIRFNAYQDDNWLPEEERRIIEKLIEKPTEGKYFDNVTIKSGSVYIHLKDEYFEKLCSKNDIMEQKSIIKGFFEEIVAILKGD
jgi:hypothetical protein